MSENASFEELLGAFRSFLGLSEAQRGGVKARALEEAGAAFGSAQQRQAGPEHRGQRH